MSGTSGCSACGMPVAGNAYHPYAACLMFKASRNSAEVEANLSAVVKHGAEEQRSRLREKVEAMRESAERERGVDRRMGYSTERMAAKAAALSAVLALLTEPGEETTAASADPQEAG